MLEPIQVLVNGAGISIRPFVGWFTVLTIWPVAAAASYNYQINCHLARHKTSCSCDIPLAHTDLRVVCIFGIFLTYPNTHRTTTPPWCACVFGDTKSEAPEERPALLRHPLTCARLRVHRNSTAVQNRYYLCVRMAKVLMRTLWMEFILIGNRLLLKYGRLRIVNILWASQMQEFLRSWKGSRNCNKNVYFYDWFWVKEIIKCQNSIFYIHSTCKILSKCTYKPFKFTLIFCANVVYWLCLHFSEALLISTMQDYLEADVFSRFSSDPVCSAISIRDCTDAFRLPLTPDSMIRSL